MFRLRFTTLVDAPVTVAFDVARSLGRPWGAASEEVASERPLRDVHVGRSGPGGPRLVHTRRFIATEAGTRVDEDVEMRGGPLLGWWLGRRVRRTMLAHLQVYAEAAERRARDVVQVVGAAVVDQGRVLVAQRRGGPFDGQWEFPGGKVEPGESHRAALVRECDEELGVVIEPGEFVGEVVLDGAVAGGVPGASTLRVWSARIVAGEPLAREHAQVRWVAAGELDRLNWISADRPLLPAVRALL